MIENTTQSNVTETLLTNPINLKEEITRSYNKMKFLETQLNNNLQNVLVFIQKEVDDIKNIINSDLRAQDLLFANNHLIKETANLALQTQNYLSNNSKWLADLQATKTRLSVLVQVFPDAANILAETANKPEN